MTTIGSHPLASLDTREPISANSADPMQSAARQTGNASSSSVKPAPFDVAPPARPNVNLPKHVMEANVAKVREVGAREVRERHTPSQAQVARKKLEKAQTKLNEAKQVGVDVAKEKFFRKLFNAGLCAIAVGVTAAATALSLGGAAPLLGLACASFAVSAGDAYCAYRNYKNIEARANNVSPLPYKELPMGNSCIANLTYSIGSKISTNHEKVATVAKCTSAAVGAGLAIAGIAVGTGLAALPLALGITRHVVSEVDVLMGGGNFLADTLSEDMDEVQEAENKVRNRVQAQVTSGTPSLDDEGEKYAASILDQLTGKDSPQALLTDAQALDNASPGSVIWKGIKDGVSWIFSSRKAKESEALTPTSVEMVALQSNAIRA